MEISRFEDIQVEFMQRAQQAVYCNVATVDSKGRPRSRVMHLIWDGAIGWSSHGLNRTRQNNWQTIHMCLSRILHNR